MEESGFGHGIEMAVAQLDAIQEAVVLAMPAAVAAGAQILKPAAVELAPIRTRHLIGTANDEPAESDAISASHRVYFEAFYARYQELGTSKMMANPFLRPAAEMRKDEILAAIQQVIGQSVDASVLDFRELMKNK